MSKGYSVIIPYRPTSLSEIDPYSAHEIPRCKAHDTAISLIRDDNKLHPETKRQTPFHLHICLREGRGGREKQQRRKVSSGGLDSAHGKSLFEAPLSMKAKGCRKINGQTIKTPTRCTAKQKATPIGKGKNPQSVQYFLWACSSPLLLLGWCACVTFLYL